MSRTTYLTTHHGSFWFQIRVPVAHQPRYGLRVRTNLQTNDPAAAKTLALRLASDWLVRFSHPPETPLPVYLLTASAPEQPAPTSVSLPEPMAPALSEAAQATPDTSGLSPHVADMLALYRYWRGLNTDRAPSTVREFERLTRTFDKFMQKTPAQLMRTDITAYRDHLLQRGDARKTVTKKLSFVSAMLQTAYDAGYLPANVARGLKVPRAKVETIKRMSFPKDSLIRIFGTRVYTERARPLAGGGEAIAWVPMLALATGARLEELCQLRVADVLEHDLGWMLNIEDGEGQRVKTSSSRRLVPLHSDVIAAGFARFVQDQRRSGHEWLFSDLEPDHDGRRGGNFGKFFARFLRQNQWCGITDRRLVFHSFRHTFKTLCREHGVAEEVHDALTGHVGSTVGRSYGMVPIERLVAAVGSLKLPVDLPRVM